MERSRQRMATTDARTGFRLPWSSDPRPDDDASTAGADQQPRSSADGQPTDSTAQNIGVDREESTMTEPTATQQAGSVAAAEASAAKPARRPSKFLADLTKAMQTAAEAAREESVSRLQADAKAAIEEIHGRSSTESGDLRRRADDDVSSIREWSKQEIARIREETETKVSDRKAQLEREIEEHAALIEHQIDRVQGRVTAFETEMAAFFDRLLAEEDPTRFAEMAESLPEPPPFDGSDFGVAFASSTSPITEAVVEPATGDVSETTVESLDAEPPVGAALTTDEAAESTWADDSTDTEAPAAAFEAADAAVVGQDEAEATETVAESEAPAAESTDAFGEIQSGPAPADQPELDPRLAAFGLSADFAAAEAEAAAAVGSADDAEDIPVIADDTLAARLAGLVPPEGAEADGPTADASVTQVVVTGLVSVASIASFKRHLGRMAGVASVGVTSGPEGEFIFSVTHGPDLVLRDAVPAMPGFQARVTGGDESTVEVTARDPESEG